jgi:hypothetical protein
MNEPVGPCGPPGRSRFRLELGFDVLDEWAGTATASEKGLVYRALFAAVDGSLFRDYRIIADVRRPGQLFVIARDDLVLKLRIDCLGWFAILYIGPCAGASVARPTHAA